MTLLLMLTLTTIPLSIMFTKMVHPLALGLTLLSQTILICLFSGLTSKSTWFPYILFLIFLGALLVLFIYVASLAANESFKLSTTTIALFLSSSIFGSCLSFLDPLTLPLKLSLEASFFSTSETSFSTPMNLSFIYNPTSMNLTLFIILYLLLTLIVVVKISCMHMGPLRLLK